VNVHAMKQDNSFWANVSNKNASHSRSPIALWYLCPSVTGGGTNGHTACRCQTLFCQKQSPWYMYITAVVCKATLLITLDLHEIPSLI
jgi:hypothetical protein